MTQPHQIDREAVALLPCPFCGETDLVADFHRLHGSIECKNCGCTVPLPEKSPEIQALRWNSRPAPMEAVAWREKLIGLQIEARPIHKHYANICEITDDGADAILALIATHPVQALDSSLRDTHRAAVTDVLADCPGCGVAPLRLHKADCEIMLSRTPASDTTGGYEAAGHRSEPKSTHPVQGGEGQ